MSSIDAETDAASASEGPELVMLTDRQVKLIVDTWAVVLPMKDKIGYRMFLKLFEIAPQLIELFPFQDEELSEENELLKKHANQVMESIGTCIELISDPEELQETLIGLGIVHHIQNVQVKSFAPVGQALIFALAEGLQDKFTQEAKEAWLTLYGIVQYFMEKGMMEGVDC